MPDKTLTRRSVHHLLAWVLALVLPLQGMAVGVFTVMGPAHIHEPADASWVLTDFRRWKPSPVRETEVFAFLGHSHRAASPQRHYHAYDDRSVVRTGDDGPLNSPDADEGPSASALLASVLALLPTFTGWGSPQERVSALAWRALWTPLTGFSEPLDRPPKLG